MKPTLKKLLILVSLIFIIHEIVIITDGLIDDDNTKNNIAVILGSKVNLDGSLSKKLKARLDRGYQLYSDAQVSKLYVSGGLGKEGFYEGTVMADYLVSKGVPEKLITIDDNGINTRHTALNFVKDYPSETSVTIVSQYFHITRCKLAFKQVGITNVTGVHCDYFELRDLYAVVREFFGFYKYLIYY